MTTVNNLARDAALNWVRTNGTRFDICTSEPTTYANAVGTASVGNAAVAIPAPVAGGAGDAFRKVVIPNIIGGSVTGNGAAAFWALTNGTDTLVATGSLDDSQTVVNGNSFNLASFDFVVGDVT